MLVCPDCERAIKRDTSTGRVVFRCYCGSQFDERPEDALVSDEILKASETVKMYQRLIHSAAFDRVNQQVKKDCPQCGLDYMTQVRVGQKEVVVWVCICGYKNMAANSEE